MTVDPPTPDLDGPDEIRRAPVVFYGRHLTSYPNDVMGAHDAWNDDIELDTHLVDCL